MKIYGNKPPEGQDLYVKAQKTVKNDPAQEKGFSGVTDRVNLSGQAKDIAEMKNAMDQLPEVRTDKIREIEKAVTDGTYRIDSKKIAGRMIDELI